MKSTVQTSLRAHDGDVAGMTLSDCLSDSTLILLCLFRLAGLFLLIRII